MTVFTLTVGTYQEGETLIGVYASKEAAIEEGLTYSLCEDDYLRVDECTVDKPTQRKAVWALTGQEQLEKEEADYQAELDRYYSEIGGEG